MTAQKGRVLRREKYVTNSVADRRETCDSGLLLKRGTHCRVRGGKSLTANPIQSLNPSCVAPVNRFQIGAAPWKLAGWSRADGFDVVVVHVGREI